MKFKAFSLSLLVFVAACDNGNDPSPSSGTGGGTFDQSVDITEAPVVKPIESATTDSMKQSDKDNPDGKVPVSIVDLPKSVPPVKWTEDETYEANAPQDFVFKDTNAYDVGLDGQLELAAVNETASAKRNTMTIKENGQNRLIPYTARAGHLTAYAPKDPKNPETKDAEASIFYMAYTRDGLPHENRPVTFFWNGGPGSSSFFLHMGSWAPERVKTGMPEMPASAKLAKPEDFPLVPNTESLLDQSDLVFVDPVGTGLSQAIKPHKNQDFWGTDEDARVIADFITRYINKYNRQSSPKYLYGESYGGIRTPIVAKLLEAAGTGEYEKDVTGHAPVVLSGIVLNSPILDYNTNSGQGGDVSVAGFVPTMGMTADYYKKATKRAIKQTDSQFADSLRAFVKDKYNAARKMWYTPELGKAKALYNSADFQMEHLKTYWRNADESRRWAVFYPADALTYGADLAKFLITDVGARQRFIDSFIVNPYKTLQEFTDSAANAADRQLTPSWLEYAISPDGIDFFAGMKSVTGLDLDWTHKFEITSNTFQAMVSPDLSLNPYDTRLNIPKGAYDITFYEDASFLKALNTVLPKTFNFTSATQYKTENFDAITAEGWKWTRNGALAYAKSSIPDLVETLGYDPSLKMLVLHGYYDLVCPFYLTELDLENVGLAKRIPVKNYSGGHMTYESEEARLPMKQELDEFYTSASVPITQ